MPEQGRASETHDPYERLPEAHQVAISLLHDGVPPGHRLTLNGKRITRRTDPKDLDVYQIWDGDYIIDEFRLGGFVRASLLARYLDRVTSDGMDIGDAEGMFR